jgi:hypothetical protein
MLNQYGINGGEVLLFNWDPFCASEWRGGDFHKIFKNFVFGWWGINNRWPPEIYVIGDPEWASVEALKKTLEWMNTKYTILPNSGSFIIPNEAKIVLYRPWEPMEDNIIEAVADWVGNRGGKLMLLGRGVGYRFKDEYESPLLKRLIGAEDHIDGLCWNVYAHNPHKVNRHPWIERRPVSSSRPLSYRYALKVSKNWMELNTELIDELVSRVRAVLYRYPSIHRRYLSVAGIPDLETARAANQNWPGWIDKGILDYVNPMSYSQDMGVFEQWCERYYESGYMTAKTVFPGIGAHQLDEQGVEKQITKARDYGSFGQVLFFNRRDIPWEIMLHLGQTVYNTVVPPAYPIRREEKSFRGRCM